MNMPSSELKPNEKRLFFVKKVVATNLDDISCLFEKYRVEDILYLVDQVITDDYFSHRSNADVIKDFNVICSVVNSAIARLEKVSSEAAKKELAQWGLVIARLQANPWFGVYYPACLRGAIVRATDPLVAIVEIVETDKSGIFLDSLLATYGYADSDFYSEIKVKVQSILYRHLQEAVESGASFATWNLTQVWRKYFPNPGEEAIDRMTSLRTFSSRRGNGYDAITIPGSPKKVWLGSRLLLRPIIEAEVKKLTALEGELRGTATKKERSDRELCASQLGELLNFGNVNGLNALMENLLSITNKEDTKDVYALVLILQSLLNDCIEKKCDENNWDVILAVVNSVDKENPRDLSLLMEMLLDVLQRKGETQDKLCAIVKELQRIKGVNDSAYNRADLLTKVNEILAAPRTMSHSATGNETHPYVTLWDIIYKGLGSKLEQTGGKSVDSLSITIQSMQELTELFDGDGIPRKINGMPFVTSQQEINDYVEKISKVLKDLGILTANGSIQVTLLRESLYDHNVIDVNTGKVVTLAKLTEDVEKLAEIYDRSDLTYVHCYSGKQRSPWMVGLLAIHKMMQLPFEASEASSVSGKVKPVFSMPTEIFQSIHTQRKQAKVLSSMRLEQQQLVYEYFFAQFAELEKVRKEAIVKEIKVDRLINDLQIYLSGFAGRQASLSSEERGEVSENFYNFMAMVIKQYPSNTIVNTISPLYFKAIPKKAAPIFTILGLTTAVVLLAPLSLPLMLIHPVRRLLLGTIQRKFKASVEKLRRIRQAKLTFTQDFIPKVEQKMRIMGDETSNKHVRPGPTTDAMVVGALGCGRPDTSGKPTGVGVVSGSPEAVVVTSNVQGNPAPSVNGSSAALS